jgi:NAD(P)-dependent dehydrogenase (short-subunit alcohol dehydrogenase family)
MNTKRNAVVTGAGSGVGRAIVLALVRQGWMVAILGRRETALNETRKLAGDLGSSVMVVPCDIAESGHVTQAARSIQEKLGFVEVLVNAAGTNLPARSLEVLSLEGYHQLIDTNLNGAYYCTQAFLPQMRQHQTGTIVNIISEAGKQASPKAGPAYVISKFGLAGLTQSINAEERANGVRACAIYPGDIDTPILDLRPNPPPSEARARMLKSEDVADCVMLAIQLPSRAIVEELTVRPR